jgi:hypothetical protein
MSISSRAGRPTLIRHAACHIVTLMQSMSMYASAARIATPWFVDSGRPNCSRSEVYFAVSASACSQQPKATAAPATSARSIDHATTSAPSPTPPSTSASLTKTCDNSSEHCTSRAVVS